MKRIIFTILLNLLNVWLCAYAQEKINIWKGTNVKTKSATLEVYRPSGSVKNRHTAIIICPGGSYCWLDYKTEGTDVAKWLSAHGFTAFVLKYRVQGKFQYATHIRALYGGNKHPIMVSDLQRSIQYVREHSILYDIIHLGTMGFSAGGHLAMSGAVYADTDFLSLSGIKHTASLQLDFVAPIYPVVSMSHPDSHKRSRRALLGEKEKRNRVLRDSLSLEKHIKNDCPPVFLVNCRDDRVVKCHNSEMLDSALTAQHVQHLYLQYRTGGHGFGASERKGTAESRQWKAAFIDWINSLNM